MIEEGEANNLQGQMCAPTRVGIIRTRISYACFGKASGLQRLGPTWPCSNATRNDQPSLEVYDGSGLFESSIVFH